jgi:hypothetical protein
MPVKYNFKDVVIGDTFTEKVITMTREGLPIDLTGASIAIQFRAKSKAGTLGKSISVGSGITITDATAGILTIAAFTVTMAVDRYFYDAEFTISGVIETYFEGVQNVLQGVTDNG